MLDSRDAPQFIDIFSIVHLLGSMAVYIFIRTVLPKYEKNKLRAFALAITVMYEGKDILRSYVQPRDGFNSIDNSIGDILFNTIGILLVDILDIPCNFKTFFFFTFVTLYVLLYADAITKTIKDKK